MYTSQSLKPCGELRNWTLVGFSKDGQKVAGEIYDHPSFPAGREVVTSCVRRVRVTEDGRRFVTTLSNCYELIGIGCAADEAWLEKCHQRSESHLRKGGTV